MGNNREKTERQLSRVQRATVSCFKMSEIMQSVNFECYFYDYIKAEAAMFTVLREAEAHYMGILEELADD